MLIYFLLFYYTLIPGSIYNRELDTKINETKTVNLFLLKLQKGKDYEVRVSWPSTSPAKIIFKLALPNDEYTKPRISDEKIMFNAIEEKQFLDVTIFSNGVGKKGVKDYKIPLNITLEQLHFGLTKHVWLLIFYTLPILIAFILFNSATW